MRRLYLKYRGKEVGMHLYIITTWYWNGQDVFYVGRSGTHTLAVKSQQAVMDRININSPARSLDHIYKVMIPDVFYHKQMDLKQIDHGCLDVWYYLVHCNLNLHFVWNIWDEDLCLVVVFVVMLTIFFFCYIITIFTFVAVAVLLLNADILQKALKLT